jgi:ribulose-5-phosphate 4-epimerase/fuculose-1-phosphate aldolase
MTRADWQSHEEIYRLFRAVGRALLLADMEDSHSGNMSLKFRDPGGGELIAITATGSQKGDLEPDQICYLSAGGTDYGYYKASSETDIHARILNLPGVGATVHAHAKDLTILTLDDVAKPSSPPDFVPVDPLGFYHLGGRVPVVWVSVPSGSRELTEKSLAALSGHRAAVIQTHGLFARARTLKEAFFLAHIANASGAVVRLAAKLGVNPEPLRSAIQAEPESCFDLRPGPYDLGPDDRCEFAEEEEIRREFVKTGARLFESRLSPFHTGSISVRGVREMLYAPKGSMPREVGGPLLRLPLEPRESDTDETLRHKAIYARSDFQTIIHCYLPEAEAQALAVKTEPGRPFGRIIPIDAEGGFLYLVIPVVPPRTPTETLIRLLHDYKIVVVRGGGVWAVGHQSLSEVLHHPSSLREICLYRIGARERGLDLEKMEPAKARRW